jgi:hypothetical protein
MVSSFPLNPDQGFNGIYGSDFDDDPNDNDNDIDNDNDNDGFQFGHNGDFDGGCSDLLFVDEPDSDGDIDDPDCADVGYRFGCTDLSYFDEPDGDACMTDSPASSATASAFASSLSSSGGDCCGDRDHCMTDIDSDCPQPAACTAFPSSSAAASSSGDRVDMELKYADEPVVESDCAPPAAAAPPATSSSPSASSSSDHAVPAADRDRDKSPVAIRHVRSLVTNEETSVRQDASRAKTVVVSYGGKLIRDYDKSMWKRMFPHLFPYGSGALDDPRRQTPVSLESWGRHLLGLHDRRFALDPKFGLVLFDVLSRQNAMSSVSIRCKYVNTDAHNAALAAVTPESLKAALLHDEKVRVLCVCVCVYVCVVCVYVVSLLHFVVRLVTH